MNFNLLLFNPSTYRVCTLYADSLFIEYILYMDKIILIDTLYNIDRSPRFSASYES